MINYLIILICVLTVAMGQILFKTVGVRMVGKSFIFLAHDWLSALLFLIALMAYGIATIGWVWVLRQVPLSTAYLFMSISFIIVPLCAYYWFNEPISLQYAIGSLLIVGGVIIAATG